MFRLSTTVLVLALLGAAVGPYAWSEKGKLASFLKRRSKQEQRQPAWDAPNFGAPEVQVSNSSVARSGGALSPGTLSPGTSLRKGDAVAYDQFLRFDLTPRWVLTRFPRVTRFAADNNWEALRVPLVTGTRPDDVVGSLTYYFNQEEQVQRITMDGRTGDNGKLAAFAQQYYKLKKHPRRSGVLLSKWNRQPISGLVMELATTIEQARPGQQVHVKLELNRPDSHVRMSRPFRQLLQ